MAGKSKRLRLRCFLEGVEVPIIGIQVMGLPNAPLMASLQLPPLAEGTRLLPRTLVHVYFLDFYEDESPFLSSSSSMSAGSENNPSAYEQALRQRLDQLDEAPDATEKDLANDYANEQYKLLFVGEIVGFDWTKNQAQRSLILQCADLSNYWDYAYQWSNTGIFGPGIKAMFSGGSTNLFTDFLSSNGEVLTRVLKTPSISYPNLKGLAGGIIHLLEAVGGSYYYDKKIAGQNVFFTIAELRLHITQMIAALENDPTASRLLSVQGYGGLFSRILGGLGGQASIRKSINALQGVIFHETYAQPCPLYEPGAEGSVSGSARKKLSEDPKTAFIAFAASGVRKNLEIVKAQVSSTENPELQLQAFQGKEALGAQRNTIVIRLDNMKRELQSVLVKLRKVDVQSAVSLLTSATQSIGKASVLVRTKWRPQDAPSIKLVVAELDRALERLRRAEQLTVATTPKKLRRPARLNQQIFRPDVWFTAPPRCNVLFPEQYDTLTYRRQFLEEPTRLLLKTNDEFFGEDELFDRFYFAPKARSLSKDKAKLQSLLQNDLLEHEILTGILPVFEKMGELNIFAVRGGVTKDKVPQVGLAQRSANFIYFKYRFAARQMTIRGKFNPYIALGFPGLIIDKYVDVATLELHNELRQKTGFPTRDINKLLGTNFLGNFTQVTHTVNQSQGATEIVATYPRQPEESVEFLGATDKEEVTVNKRFDKDALRTTDVAALFPPQVLSVGPSAGRIVRVTEVTDLYKGQGGTPEGAASTKPLLLFGSSQSRKPRQESDRVTARVPVGFVVDARKLPANVRKELGIEQGTDNQFNPSQFGARGTAQPVKIRAFRIEEEVPRYKQEVVDLPAEEYIRPGWYGDVWHPSKIGEAYNTFFRTGAITDPHQITDPGGASLPVTGDVKTDSLGEASGLSGLGDPRIDAPAVFSLSEGASIEQAVGYLVATYSHIKQNGYDVDEFIRAYTWRPIASMVDMFGTSDLVLSSDGSEIIQGIEGFHSRAFGPWNDLFGLVTPDIEEIVGLKRGTTAASRGDTRKLKQDAVKDYVSALTFTRAVLG